MSEPAALTGLDVFVGGWVVETHPPGGLPAAPQTIGEWHARSRFEWALDRQFLLQRTDITIPGAPPKSLAIVSTDLATGAYTQHYFDSRGVVRLYAMTFSDGVWTLARESPDFTRLDFRQRFTGTFSEDGNTISGTWEKCVDGDEWEVDFDLTYRRAD